MVILWDVASGRFSWLTGTSCIVDFPMKKTPFIDGFPMIFPLKAAFIDGFPHDFPIKT